MATQVDVSTIFRDILNHTLNHLCEEHGEASMHHLFFELYNHTFSFLEREFGFEAVQAYWDSVADRALSDLERLMRTKGFKGMEEYWRATLGQEGADYEMHVTDDSLHVTVKRCPPVEWFEAKTLNPYRRYCAHCERLYRRVGERCGFAMEYFPPDVERGTCCGLRFTRAK